MKNQDKATANYTKRFIKKKDKSPSNQPKDSQDPESGWVANCKLYEKKHGPNECMYLQAEFHYCYKTCRIAKFCKRK